MDGLQRFDESIGELRNTSSGPGIEMIGNYKFLQFAALMEMIDGYAKNRRTEAITLRGPTGQTVGLITLENGMVRFGVEYLGQIYFDATISLHAPALVSLIRKYNAGGTITEEESNLVGEPYVSRQVLCKATAQALRQLASRTLSSGLRKPVATIGLPPGLRRRHQVFAAPELRPPGGLDHDGRHEPSPAPRPCPARPLAPLPDRDVQVALALGPARLGSGVGRLLRSLAPLRRGHGPRAQHPADRPARRSSRT